MVIGEMMDYEKIYAEIENYFGSEPDEFLLEHLDLLNLPGLVLDLGAGQGRNAIYLARAGFEVHAVEKSPAACDKMSNSIIEENLKLKIFNQDIYDFQPESHNSYSAIMIMGVIPELDWDSIFNLREKVKNCLTESGLVFIKAFTVKDASYEKCINENKAIGKNSFVLEDGSIRTFLEENELKNIFNKFEVLFYIEEFGPLHDHGDGHLEQHARVQAIFRNK
jgi:cyclopropane fatty-acyl-phospholipid synthase-like methyltransferase